MKNRDIEDLLIRADQQEDSNLSLEGIEGLEEINKVINKVCESEEYIKKYRTYVYNLSNIIYDQEKLEKIFNLKDILIEIDKEQKKIEEYSNQPKEVKNYRIMGDSLIRLKGLASIYDRAVRLIADKYQRLIEENSEELSSYLKYYLINQELLTPKQTQEIEELSQIEEQIVDYIEKYRYMYLHEEGILDRELKSNIKIDEELILKHSTYIKQYIEQKRIKNLISETPNPLIKKQQDNEMFKELKKLAEEYKKIDIKQRYAR